MPLFPAPPSVVVALLTPFADDGAIDPSALREHVLFLIEQGVDGLMPCGTTAEGPLLEEAEAVATIAAVVDAAGGRVPVLAHVGRPSTAPTVRLARGAIAGGCDAVSAVVPYFYALDDRQVLAHYRALMEAAQPAPAFAYTIPARVGNDLSPSVTEVLADEGLAGIKDSTKSLERHLEYLAVAERHHGFALFMGSDGLVLPALRAGAAGVVSALANARPELLMRLKRALLEGRDGEAEALQEEISRARESLAAQPPLVALKQATADRLREVGIAYPSGLRAPLG